LITEIQIASKESWCLNSEVKVLFLLFRLRNLRSKRLMELLFLSSARPESAKSLLCR
jgi:hypothetical protein